MKASNIIPAAFLVVGISVSGAMVATAQNVPAADDAARVEQADFRGHDRDGEHRSRGGWGREDHGRKGFGPRGGGMQMQKIFAEVDADGNGAVTQDEINAYRTAKVGAADTSGDGALSIEEFDTLFREFTRSRMVDAFQNLDDDGDGLISPAELDDRLNGMVKRMDRNGDGVLSLQDRRG